MYQNVTTTSGIKSFWKLKLVDTEFLKELITDHANRPRNQRQLARYTCKCTGKNPLCGDEVSLEIDVDQNSDVINDIAFRARGCPISRASASIVTETCLGMTSADAGLLAKHLRETLTEQCPLTLPDQLSSAWSKVTPLTAIRVNPARIKCITLAWHTLCHALDNPGSTETVD